MQRLFICDPICAQSFGHNLSALHYFQGFLAGEFYETEIRCLVSKYLPENIEDTKGLNLDRVFHHYYQSTIALENYDSSQEELSFKETASSYNYLENLAYDDILKLHGKYQFKASDRLFFPSVDFYSAQALLRFVEVLGPQKSPELYLRFIGVMENNSKYYTEPRSEIFHLLKRLRKKSYRIKVSAETPKYSDFIAERVDGDVSCLTYPAVGESYPLQENSGSFKILCPGAQRRDKGFERIFNIAKTYLLENPDTQVEFFLQEARGKQYLNYNSQLYALPGMNLLASSITMEQMQSLYQQSHLILLPYDPAIYYLRGSAVLMEAISYGRLVLTSAHTAFSDQVRYYNNGAICKSDEDFARAIREFYDSNKKKMQRRAQQSKFRYETDCTHSYRSWFQC